MHKITHIAPGSIGESLGLAAGDFLLEIDGQAVGDVFDYRMGVQSEALTVLVEKSGGELWELDIEKDADEDLGLTFATALMDEVRLCRNRCIFCFVDQQPPGLRGSLYVKDDDPRLSFLHGNYVTLTNIDEGEVARLIRHRLSPLRISVHTVEAGLRARMMGNAHAGRLTDALARFNQAGMQMHFQAVICKGYNDGAELEETIAGLLAFRPGALSLAIVPAGLTGHRRGLAALEAFAPEDAREVIARVDRWREKCRARYGTSFVFAADEWYILAGMDLPGYTYYEDFPQLDNGVGLCALFEEEFVGHCPTPRKLLKKLDQNFTMGIVTGVAAYGFMCALAGRFEGWHPGVRIKVFEIRNDFFGASVTVSGLLTGGDVIQQLRGQCQGLDVLFLPHNAFRAGTETMLDGVTRGEVEAALGVAVRIGSAQGEAFYRELIAE
ncbi:MAG: DUF512 domain-containing protein [Defluviitaleaceae bacterium]|nr:DUF512 domain-containing protein [Defluviitaleaceae bacterium]MCL2238605.1 DUF512 domain-containing protein [Defluviitaleaceae bacterium]